MQSWHVLIAPQAVFSLQFVAQLSVAAIVSYNNLHTHKH
jgi:hypothetical protein